MEQLTAADQLKRTGLRRMKLVATGFFLAATAVFVVALVFEEGGPAWIGYVRAAAEAGMVGALADWFAVTALFRRPLGLPIPHTAIIPTRKDTFGDALGSFVGTNFLSADVVQDKLRRVGIAQRVGAWLVQPDHAERVTSELSNVVKGAITVLRDDDVQAIVEQAVLRRLTDQPWGPPLGRLLGQVLTDRAHHKLVDLMCDRAYDWVRDNHDRIVGLVSERSPVWSPKFMDSLLGDKVYNELLNFAWAVKTDGEHPMRQAVDQFLISFSADLQHDPATVERAEAVKQQVVDHPDVQRLIGSAWGTAKGMLLTAAEDPSSELRKRIREGLMSFGQRLVSDESMRAKVDGWLEGAAGHVVGNYRDEITTLITDTVERWDAEETSRKIELQVGRDLQFIRINGTVVGALAGLVIYTIGQLVV
ncbi:uncharacterized membrane-anchored protein YjiN (DUF445 family) [Saccharothrix tamanrassetensis]|uniref:Uncharacterized membrane-anchored protein YjiN (DUF445 family) n=2 Tax=Saccharothrix tamanrassetensis TaxID=1051531 RepID=A0A841CB90_9PSEU|nr:uncharacterized membrane-anchored protein YjiN (DUF445 family) [Saccharothrix tamanrassetensis]